MATKQEKWQEIANRGLQDNFDPQTRAKFDEAVKRGLITMPNAQQPIEQPQQAADPLQEMRDLPPLEGQGETGFLGKFGSLFSGKNRETAMTQALQDQYDDMGMIETQNFVNDFMGGKDNAARYEAETLTVFDPMEQAQIATKLNPELNLQVEKDAQGNDYPVLVNSRTGQASMVNNIGLDPRDALKAFGTGLLFLRGKKFKGGLGKQVAKEAGRSMGIQSAIEGQHAASGGEFNPLDVAAAGIGGAVGELIPITAQNAWRRVKGLFSGSDDAARTTAQASPEEAIASSLTDNQKARVEAMKQGYEAKKGELTSLEKLEQMKQALAEGDETKVAAMIGVDDEYLAAMKELGLQEKGLTSAATNDVQIQQLEQGLKKIPASESSAKEAAQIAELGQKADDLILEFGGDLDKSSVSQKLLNKVKSGISDLGVKSEEVYDSIRESIPNDAKAAMGNTGDFLQNELDELGGDLSQFSALEKQLLKMSQSDNVTYKAIDKIRKKIGAKIGGSSTAFADEDTATLKNIYSLLTEDQEVVAGDYGMGDAWKAGKELVKKRKVLEDDAVKLFGKDLNENIMSKLGSATKKLSKGDYKQFFDIINSVPKRDRQEVIISSLNDAFTLGSRKENQLSTAGFADWYNGLSRNPQLKSAIYGYLPPKLSKQIDALGKVTNNIRNSMSQAPVGGQVLATPTFLDGIANKVGEKMLSKLPGFVGDVVNAGLDKGKMKGTENAIKVLSSPEFLASIKALAQGQAKKAQALEKSLLQRNETKEWLKTLTKQEQNLIIREGLINWIQSDEQDEQN